MRVHASAGDVSWKTMLLLLIICCCCCLSLLSYGRRWAVGASLKFVVVGGVVTTFSPHTGSAFSFNRGGWPLLAGELLFYFHIFRYRHCYCRLLPAVAPRYHPGLLQRGSCDWPEG